MNRTILILCLAGTLSFLPSRLLSQFYFQDTDSTGTILPPLQAQIRGQWNASNVATGMYIYQLTMNNQQGKKEYSRKKMLMIK